MLTVLGVWVARRLPCATFQFVSLIVVAGTWGQIGRVRGSSEPRLLMSAGGFTAVQIGHAPEIGGREWVAADVQATSSPGVLALSTRSFSLTRTDCGDHSGDFERCHLLFRRGRARPVRIDAGFTGWVYVTPDSRYIFTEPLYALDVRAWKQYALSDALRIPNYVSIDAISRDGRRLLVSRSDCAIDCRDQPRQYYELTLPR